MRIQTARRKADEVAFVHLRTTDDLDAAASWIRSGGGNAWRGGAELLVNGMSAVIGDYIVCGDDRQMRPLSGPRFASAYDVTDCGACRLLDCELCPNAEQAALQVADRADNSEAWWNR